MKPRSVFIGVIIISQVVRDLQARDAADREQTFAGIHRPCWRMLLLYLFSALLYTSAFALDRDRALTQFHHTAWRASDGAPSQTSALAQTADGYLWIGSARGLFRFDGVRFETYAPPQTTTISRSGRSRI